MCVKLKPKDQPACFVSLIFIQMVDSEDSDVDTGFYSDGEGAPPPKRRSLLVALRCVNVN